MKKLFILRHAKSSWNDPGLADFDRPLNDRGLNAAPFIGEIIAKRRLLPDIILSSPAKRAMQTATLVKEAAGSNAVIKYDDRIYEASPQALRQVISEIDESSQFVMIVGHNPGIESFVKFLSNSTERMPTAALAVLSLDIGAWKDVSPGCCTLEVVIRPKEEMKFFSKHGS
ncbi:MAG: histidine phosphatase family protein [Acidobacteriota bacterium]|nr:histidine phosphatase family protein [Acidobacteriota bacterium]